MTQTDWSAFFRKIDALPKGDRVSLKREAGTMLSQANGRAICVFYQCLPYSVPQWQEERAFAAACLHCLWDADEARRQPMEQIFISWGGIRMSQRAWGIGWKCCWIFRGMKMDSF